MVIVYPRLRHGSAFGLQTGRAVERFQKPRCFFRMKTGMEPQFTRGLSIKIHQPFGFHPVFFMELQWDPNRIELSILGDIIQELLLGAV